MAKKWKMALWRVKSRTFALAQMASYSFNMGWYLNIDVSDNEIVTTWYVPELLSSKHQA